MKKLNKKGFTLMEMLIVVAIIAILVAIAIPTMTSALEKARESADAANIRSCYADVMVMVLTEDAEAVDRGAYTVAVTDEAITGTVALAQQQSDWQNKTIKDIAGTKIADLSGVDKDGTVTVTYTYETGECVIAVA